MKNLYNFYSGVTENGEPLSKFSGDSFCLSIIFNNFTPSGFSVIPMVVRAVRTSFLKLFGHRFVSIIILQWQVIGQEEISLNRCFYRERGKLARLIRCLINESGVIPIEVKSADNTQAKSLGRYVELYKPPYAVKIADKNFGFENGKKTIPLYAAFCL